MTLTEFFNYDPTWPKTDVRIACQDIIICLNTMDYFTRRFVGNKKHPNTIYYIINSDSPYNMGYTDSEGQMVECRIYIPEDKILQFKKQLERKTSKWYRFIKKPTLIINLKTMQVEG